MANKEWMKLPFFGYTGKKVIEENPKNTILENIRFLRLLYFLLIFPEIYTLACYSSFVLLT